jgi:hypothetical protein
MAKKLPLPPDPSEEELADPDETWVSYVSGYDDVPMPDGSVFKQPKYRRVTMDSFKAAGLG